MNLTFEDLRFNDGKGFMYYIHMKRHARTCAFFLSFVARHPSSVDRLNRENSVMTKEMVLHRQLIMTCLLHSTISHISVGSLEDCNKSLTREIYRFVS